MIATLSYSCQNEWEDIADVRIHKVCVCVCVHTYVHLHVFTSAYASIPPSREEKKAILRIVCTGDDIGRTPGDAQIASSSEDLARPQCLNNSPRASSEHSIAT